jgi:hypothetical protein
LFGKYRTTKEAPMGWYEREVIGQTRLRELERDVEYRRRTTGADRAGRPFYFWLLVALRSWLIGVAR